MKRSLLILCVFCGLSSAAAATESEAVVTAETLGRAVLAAGPGRTLVLADGVYRDVKRGFSAKGEPDKPITLRAQTPGKVVIVGRSELTISGERLVVSGL